MYNKTEEILQFHTNLSICQKYVKVYLSSQQIHKLTETNLCKKKKKIILWRFKLLGSNWPQWV